MKSIFQNCCTRFPFCCYYLSTADTENLKQLISLLNRHLITLKLEVYLLYFLHEWMKMF